jgi:hypothetical protein
LRSHPPALPLLAAACWRAFAARAAARCCAADFAVRLAGDWVAAPAEVPDALGGATDKPALRAAPAEA